MLGIESKSAAVGSMGIALRFYNSPNYLPPCTLINHQRPSIALNLPGAHPCCRNLESREPLKSLFWREKQSCDSFQPRPADSALFRAVLRSQPEDLLPRREDSRMDAHCQS